MRGTSNGNVRGSAAQRRARKQWLLDIWGDGIEAPCHYCAAVLTFLTLTVDRVIPGCRGGRYVRGNIRPACAPCNSVHGGTLRA